MEDRIAHILFWIGACIMLACGSFLVGQWFGYFLVTGG